MIEEQYLFAIRRNLRGRKSWVCPNGKLGTVEEVVRNHYIDCRGFTDCLIDSACVYGGLTWMLFHDILFHSNIQRRQPLCISYLRSPQKFFERHHDLIEQRLTEYASNRKDVFDKRMLNFCNHPFFKAPESNIEKYHGAWMRRNRSGLGDFASMSVEHGQEELIRESIQTSTGGRNAGWPDLVAWSASDLVFVEVKSTDTLSDAQCQWISSHQDRFKVEIVRVIDRKSTNAMHSRQLHFPGLSS